MDAARVATEIERALRPGRPCGGVELEEPPHGAATCRCWCPRSTRIISSWYREQQRARGWKGQIVTNPNCSTIGLTMGLGPLKPFGITKVIVTTMRRSRAPATPAWASMDIMGNVIPFHRRRRRKMQVETQKILGAFRGDHIEPLAAKVSAQCNRVAVVDGHTEAVSVEVFHETVRAGLAPRHRGVFRCAAGTQAAQRARLAGDFLEENNRPQPRKDADRGRGMTASVGRLRPCPVLDWKFVCSAITPFAARRARPCSRRVDAFGRDARLMIVMKFGGRAWNRPPPSPASPPSSKRARIAIPVVVVSAMGKTTNKLLAIAAAAIKGPREEYLRQIHDLRDFHFPRGAPGGCARGARRARPFFSTSISRS